jgi:hypothetical protein
VVESQWGGLHMVGDRLDTLALMKAVPQLLSNCGVEDGSHSGSGIKPLGEELFLSQEIHIKGSRAVPERGPRARRSTQAVTRL